MQLSCVLIVIRLRYRLLIDEFFRPKTLVVNLNSVGFSALAMEDKISEGVTSFKAEIIQSGKSIPGEYHNWPVYLAVCREGKEAAKTYAKRARTVVISIPFSSHLRAPDCFVFIVIFIQKSCDYLGALWSKRVKRLLTLYAMRARHKGCHAPKLEHVKTLFSSTWFNTLVF